MYTYSILEPGSYYLVQLVENGPMTLVQIKVVSDFGMYVAYYENELRMDWVKKTDAIFDIVELLSEDVAQKWYAVYMEEHRPSFFGGMDNGDGEDDDEL